MGQGGRTTVTFYNIDGGQTTVEWDKKAKTLQIQCPPGTEYGVVRKPDGGLIVNVKEG